jgi:putative ABC transport system permease protein
MRTARSHFGIAFSGVLQRRVRSLLTVLTASIAIASVVASMAILKGGRRRVKEDLSKLGLDIIVVQNVMPSFGPVLKSKLLTLSRAEQIRDELREDAEAVAPAVFRRYSVCSAADENWKPTTVIGTTAEFGRMLNLSLKGGRFLAEEDVLRDDPVCVMDHATKNEIFGDEDALGKEVVMVRGTSRLRLEVIGVLEDPYKLRKPRGQLDTVAMSRNIFASRLEFKNIYVPVGLIWEEGDNISTVLVKTRNADRVESAMAKIERLLSPEKEYVAVWAQKEWILGTLRAVHDFTGYSNIIWVIMVCVAAVMIKTISLLSVRERYREIAIRRTEGATKRAIGIQFGLEGVFLCATGGLAGIGLGVVLAKVVEATILRWEVVFSVSAILIAAGISVAVGIVSSIWPAKHAASLDPIQVLRMH